MVHQVELFYDIVSPYSYLAFINLIKLSKQWSFNLILTPSFLGGVMHSTGNSPPATLPAKARFINIDLQRSAHYQGISMVSTPDKFPILSLVPMRALIWIQKTHPDKLVQASIAMWEHYWGRGEDISTVQAVQLIMEKLGIHDHNTWRTAIQSAEIKQQLLDNTARAVESGAFGFPWMLVKKSGESTEHVIFGSDRFHHLAMLLGIKTNSSL